MKHILTILILFVGLTLPGIVWSQDQGYTQAQSQKNQSADVDFSRDPAVAAGDVEIISRDGKTKWIDHPGAAKGLIRINKDGSFQYRVRTKEKSQAATLRLGLMSTPVIENETRGLNFADMYGSNPASILVDYDWQPFRAFGALGLQFGSGFGLYTGRGRLTVSGVDLESEEKFSLMVIPLSLNVLYRFEYSRKQWLVPYLAGGATYYALIEKRDDRSSFSYAGSPAAGGGGGFHFSITRWDHKTGFIMDRDYGVADMWLTFDFRVMQGLKPEIDFSSTIASAGITVDW